VSAIGRELGRPAIRVDGASAQPALLRIVVDSQLRALVYYHDDDEELTRAITLPGDPASAIETLALLAGNLARDQVRELARQFARSIPAAERADAPVTPATAPTATVVSRPVAPRLVLVPPEERYRGRLGIYAMVGGGASLQKSPIAPVIVGVALRWRLAAIALEGLGGLWSVGYVGGDIAVMLHHPVGPLLLGGGVAGGAVAAFTDHAVPVGIVRAFLRASWAARPSLDLFAQLDFGYGRVNNLDQEGLMLNVGVQVRLVR
jgi:hypothetical protein